MNEDYYEPLDYKEHEEPEQPQPKLRYIPEPRRAFLTDAKCYWHECPRQGRPPVGAQARKWVVVSIHGFPFGVYGPEEGFELTRPVAFCSWACAALFCAEAGDLR